MVRKSEMESWEDLVAAEIADWDRAEAADDAFLDDLLMSGDSFEEVHCGCRELDVHRWELDPASAEDYGERSRGVRPGLSLRWRHFGH